MPRPPVHSALIAQQIKRYLDDLSNEVGRSRDQLPRSQEYRSIFKTSLATYLVARKLGQRQIPLVKAAGGVARRLPLLIACRQVSLARVDLRRFAELVVAFTYFREHPVEWAERVKHPEHGFARENEDPIAYCAHREFGWYASYARERFTPAPCATIRQAIADMKTLYGSLSGDVHAAAATMPGGRLTEPLDSIAGSELRTISRTQRRMFSAGCILVGATRPHGLAPLDAVERGWFDWLIGGTRARSIRACHFGV